MFKKSTFVLLALVMITSLLSGCMGNNKTAVNTESKQENKVETPPAPIELLIYANMPPEDYSDRYPNLLGKKFPYVTFTQVTTSKEQTLEQLISSTPVDIVDYGITNLKALTDLNIPLDLGPFISKYKVDLNRFDGSVIQDIRSYSDKGKLLMLPYSVTPFVLHYNKDIFDKFGVGYPKNGATWADLIELSKKLSRTADGVNYRGLSAGSNVNRLQTQLSLPFIDTKTEKPLISTSEGWKKLYKTYQDIYSVPGNFPEGAKYNDAATAFNETRTLAMFPNLFGLGTINAIKSGIKVGISTFPVFPDLPNVSTGLFGQAVAVSQTSKHPDVAFQVIDYLTSKEAQSELGKLGSVTPLVDKDVRSKLFEGNPLANTLDLSILYQLRVADPYPKTKWDAKALNIVSQNMQKFVSGQADMNTTMRTVDEAIDAMIKAN